MRYLLWLVSIPLTVFVVLFAVSNPQKVQVMLVPLEGQREFSLAAIGLALMALGFLAGSLFVGIQGYRTQLRKWQETRRADRLEKELEKFRAERRDTATPFVLPK